MQLAAPLPVTIGPQRSILRLRLPPPAGDKIDSGTDSDADSNADSDADWDADRDADSDLDSDTASDAVADPAPPAPRGSGVAERVACGRDSWSLREWEGQLVSLIRHPRGSARLSARTALTVP